ncbi:MAG: isochorismate synthase [Gemmatimonadetes bacterium]|nr:isochorismate synthase [Gemmatimonadota bacterium]
MGEIVERALPDVDPRRLLRRGAGGPRGFWARGDRWIAHAGVARGPDGAVDLSIEGGHDRLRLLSGLSASVWDQWGTGRLYGGLSFSEAHEPGGVWKGFPPGRFQLPAVELVKESGLPGCRLTARGPSVSDAAALADRWGAWLVEAPPPGPPGREIAAEPSGADRLRWTVTVRRALEEIASGQVGKVVLARALDVSTSGALDPAEVACLIWLENPSSHAFLFEPNPGHALVGGAPEVLAHKTGTRVRSTAVAGSTPVGATPGESTELARRLFDHAKDRAEHDFVVEDMVRKLEELGCSVRRDVEPHVLTLARIQHLETKIEAAAPASVSLLDLIEGLHPTPAVCGHPRDRAHRFLEGHEGLDRGWYAGPVGWVDHLDDGIFVPALRSAVCSGGPWRLFAGAGIVEGSDPDLEWEETALKFEPVLRALVGAGASSEILRRVA